MVYSVDNPPRQIVQGLSGTPSLWVYVDGDDDATVNGAGYFSNGADLGMKLGDFLLHFDTTTPRGSVHFVTSVTVAGVPTMAFAAVA